MANLVVYYHALVHDVKVGGTADTPYSQHGASATLSLVFMEREIVTLECSSKHNSLFFLKNR
jgi:hypothetical protein